MNYDIYDTDGNKMFHMKSNSTIKKGSFIDKIEPTYSIFKYKVLSKKKSEEYKDTIDLVVKRVR